MAQRRFTAPGAILDGLTQGTKYRVRLRAYVGEDTSQWGPYSTFETGKILGTPSAPGIVVSPGNIEGRLGISWDAVSGADGYELLISPALTIPIAVAGTSYNFDGEGGQTFEARVRAVALPNEAQDLVRRHFATVSRGDYSLPTSATARNVKPGAPTNIMQTQGAESGQIDMDWTAAVGADRYEIQWTPFTIGFDHPSITPVPAGTHTGTSASFNAVEGARGVAIGDLIATRIRSLRDHADAGDWVSPSPSLIEVRGGRPPAPETLTATASVIASGRIDLVWSEVSNASGYVWAARPVGTTIWSETGTTVTRATFNGTVGVTYEFRVRARVPSSPDGAWTDPPVRRQAVTLTGGTTPSVRGVPELRLSHGTTDGAIVAAWSDVSGTNGYRLEYRQGTSGSYTTVRRTSAQRTYTLAGTAGRTYQLRVRATFASEPTLGDRSATQSFTATLRAPGAVTGFSLRATRANEANPLNGQTTIDWNVVSRATGYEFEQYSDAALTTRTLQRTTTPGSRTSRRMGGTVGTPYWYRMRALRTGADSAGPWTDAQRFVASNLDTANLAGPTLSVVAGSSRTRANVSWTAVANTTGYILQSKTGTDAFSTISGVTGTSHTFTGAVGTTETFRVKAQFSGGNETAWSSEVAWAFRAAGPTLTLSAGDNEGEIDLSWTAVTGHTNWAVQVQFGDGDWTALTTGVDQSARTATYTGTTGTAYKFRVRGNSTATRPFTDWSDEKSITLARAGPVLTAAGGTTAGQIALTWTEVSGATGYRLEQKSGTGSFTHVSAVSGTGRSHTFTGTGGTAYTFRIRAITADGNTSWSAEVTFTAPAALTASPTGTLTNSTTTSLRIELSAVEGATGYKYRRVVDGTAQSAISVDASSREFNLTGLTANTDYIFQFQASNSLGAGPWSSNQTFRTAATTLPVPILGNIVGDSTARYFGGDVDAWEYYIRIRITVTVPTGADGVQIQTSFDETFEDEPELYDYTAAPGTHTYTFGRDDFNYNQIFSVRARSTLGDTTGPWSGGKMVYVAFFGEGGGRGAPPERHPELLQATDTSPEYADLESDEAGDWIEDSLEKLPGILREFASDQFSRSVSDAINAAINDAISRGGIAATSMSSLQDIAQSVAESFGRNIIGRRGDRGGGGGVGTGDPYGGDDTSGGGGRDG